MVYNNLQNPGRQITARGPNRIIQIVSALLFFNQTLLLTHLYLTSVSAHKWFAGKKCSTSNTSQISLSSDEISKEQCLQLCRQYTGALSDHLYMCCDYDPDNNECLLVATNEDFFFPNLSNLLTYLLTDASDGNRLAYPNVILDNYGGWIMSYIGFESGSFANDSCGSTQLGQLSGGTNVTIECPYERPNSRTCSITLNQCYQHCDNLKTNCNLQDDTDRYFSCNYKTKQGTDVHMGNEYSNGKWSQLCQLKYIKYSDHALVNPIETRWKEFTWVYVDFLAQRDCFIVEYPWENLKQEVEQGQEYQQLIDAFKIKPGCFTQDSPYATLKPVLLGTDMISQVPDLSLDDTGTEFYKIKMQDLRFRGVFTFRIAFVHVWENQCYDQYRSPIAGCQCHSSCHGCGFKTNPIGDKDCIMCVHGQVTPIFSDGTGSCDPSQSQNEQNGVFVYQSSFDRNINVTCKEDCSLNFLSYDWEIKDPYFVDIQIGQDFFNLTLPEFTATPCSEEECPISYSIQSNLEEVQLSRGEKTTYDYEHRPWKCVLHYNMREIPDKTVDECKEICNNLSNCLAFEYGVGNGSVPEKECRPLNGKDDNNGCNGFTTGMDLYVKIRPLVITMPADRNQTVNFVVSATSGTSGLGMVLSASNITVHVLGNITSTQDLNFPLLTGGDSAQETSFSKLNDGVKENLWVRGARNKFQYPLLVCSFGCEIEFRILSEQFYNLSQIDYLYALSYDQDSDSVSGIKLEQFQHENGTNILEIQVENSNEASFRFYVMGLAKDMHHINFTSGLMQFEVTIMPFNYAPQFESKIELQHFEFDKNQEIEFTLPGIIDDKDDPADIQVEVFGLNETLGYFDDRYRKLVFNYFNQSINLTLEIVLIDLEQASSQYLVDFFLESEEVESTFEGVVVQYIDGVKVQKKQEFDDPIQIYWKPVSPDGILIAYFSEDLRIPQTVRDLLNQRKGRLLQEATEKQIRANKTLDLYIDSFLEIDSRQFVQEIGEYKDDGIAFNPHLVDWNEKRIELLIDFTYPLQISQSGQPDQLLINFKKSDIFVSKENPGKVYNSTLQYSSPMMLEIQNQLPKGSRLQKIQDTVREIKVATFTLAILQIILQVIMKGSKRQTIQIFLSLQLISCLYLLSLSDPTIVQIVLKEMYDFVNFSMFKPVSLWIFGSSVLFKFKSEKSFKEIYLLRSQEIENEESILQELDPMLSIYALSLTVFFSSLVLCFCKKPRGLLIKKLFALKKEMVWNGLLLFLETCYINYCILMTTSIEDFQEEKSVTIEVEMAAYIFIIFVVQLIIFIRLIFITNDEMRTKKSQEIIGHLTKDIQLRQGGEMSKFYYSLSQLTKALIVFSVIMTPSSQFYQLMIANLSYYLYLVVLIQICHFKGSPVERLLRHLTSYFISLCFLCPMFFIGKFIESDNDKTSKKLEWLGFLKDEYLHFNMGFYQVSLFGMVLFLGVVNMMLPFIRLLKASVVRRVVAIIKSKCFTIGFNSQHKSKSSDKYQVMRNRMDKQDSKLKEYKELCRLYSKDLCHERFMKRFGELSIEEQKYTKNEFKLSQLKYKQLGIVLSSKTAFMSQAKVDKLKSKYETKVMKLLYLQQQHRLQGVGLGSNFDYENYKVSYLDLPVYEVMDMLEADVIAKCFRFPGVKQAQLRVQTPPKVVLKQRPFQVKEKEPVQVKEKVYKLSDNWELLPKNIRDIGLDENLNELDPPTKPKPKKKKQKKVPKTAKQISASYKSQAMPTIQESLEEPQLTSQRQRIKSIQKKRLDLTKFNKAWAKTEIIKYIQHPLQQFDKIDDLEANGKVLEFMCNELSVTLQQMGLEENQYILDHFERVMQVDEREYQEILDRLK